MRLRPHDVVYAIDINRTQNILVTAAEPLHIKIADFGLAVKLAPGQMCQVMTMCLYAWYTLLNDR